MWQRFIFVHKKENFKELFKKYIYICIYFYHDLLMEVIHTIYAQYFSVYGAQLLLNTCIGIIIIFYCSYGNTYYKKMKIVIVIVMTN